MIRLAFYGDDFTGASDNAAQYARHGLRTLLYFSNPDADALRRAAQHYDVIGVAGVARSLAPDAMAAELLPVLRNFDALRVPFIQYKCCSTFDSSAETGSLGAAIRLMRTQWPDSLVPVVAATPEFGRYTIFGDHYARAGQQVYRLDRHPIMAVHPVTPMREASLARILAQQGFNVGRAVDLRQLDDDDAPALAAALAGDDGVVFDGYTQRQMKTIAASLWQVSHTRTVCALAAQGLAHAMGDWLRDAGLIDTPLPQQALAPTDRLLVLSGSCSSLSAAQIDWALAHGFDGMRIAPALLAADAPQAAAALESQMLAALDGGRSVVIYSAKGPDDARDAALPPAQLASRIGLLYARLACAAISRGALKRLVIAGGDSSSFTMRELGATALEVKASHFAQNAHVCSVHADDPAVHGVEVLLKGGQVGAEDLYGLMLKGFS